MDYDNPIVEKDYKNKSLFSMNQGVMPWITLDTIDEEELNENTSSSVETRKMLSTLGLTETDNHIRHIEPTNHIWS